MLVCLWIANPCQRVDGVIYDIYNPNPDDPKMVYVTSITTGLLKTRVLDPSSCIADSDLRKMKLLFQEFVSAEWEYTDEARTLGRIFFYAHIWLNWFYISNCNRLTGANKSSFDRLAAMNVARNGLVQGETIRVAKTSKKGWISVRLSFIICNICNLLTYRFGKEINCHYCDRNTRQHKRRGRRFIRYCSHRFLCLNY